MPQNTHVKSFLEMLAVERGAAVRTCESYRRSLGRFAEFLSMTPPGPPFRPT